jgi:glycosyltransferase involved in cell wall biosynthesis
VSPLGAGPVSGSSIGEMPRPTLGQPEAAPARRVLMVAFHYPPCFGSSGVHRTLKFSRYLPSHGWQPIVLTVRPEAYQQTTPHQLGEIPDRVRVVRAPALDARRHLAIRGRSIGVMSLPDQWWSWWLTAVPIGLRLIRKYRPSVLWSTYPIATAHLIALTLHRLSGLPWMAEFRDPMTEDDYPPHRLTRRIYRSIEKRTARDADRLVFTARSAREMYLERYPDLEPERCLVITNGYDEVDFTHLRPTTVPRVYPLRLVHSGVVYPEERDPGPFFRALARLKGEGRVTARTLRVDLRAAGSEPYFRGLAKGLGIEDLVHLLPPLAYRESLQDSADATALLVLQGASCNHQIPAKAYEYLRLGKPILALTPAEGDTAALLAECGGSTLVDLHDEDAIHDALPPFLDSLLANTHASPDPARACRYARHTQAAELAACLAALA